jgi:transcriptional regulator with XRE-family HTH domain
MSRLGAVIRRVRGDEPRAKFARRLGLSYTFVRAMEAGFRLPSDKVLLDIANILERDASEFLLAAWCDRSPELGEVLLRLGVPVPEPLPEDPKPPAYEGEWDGFGHGNGHDEEGAQAARAALDRRAAHG